VIKYLASVELVTDKRLDVIEPVIALALAEWAPVILALLIDTL
jgi:hypothetical protein